MPKAYIVNAYRAVHDPARLAEYAALSGPALAAAGGRFLVRGTALEAFESGVRERTVVIEFDTVDQARAFYHGDAYQAAVAVLGDTAERDVRLIEGAPDLSPD